MLILSRRPGQCVQFPTLGIAVELLRINGNTIRLGIDAPPEIPVLRQELVTKKNSSPSGLGKTTTDPEWIHKMRGKLNLAVMGLHLAEKQLQKGFTAEAQTTLENALRELESLDRTFAKMGKKSEPKPRSKPLEALVVEDNLNEEALLRSYLQMSGVHVDAVHDGDEALNYLSTHKRPDFILLDMHLPKVDGPTMLSRIRKDPSYRGTRVFAVTGRKPEELGISTDDMGVDAWFTKPVNPSRIVQAMFDADN